MRGCDGSGCSSGCPACWSKEDWRILHLAASTTVQLYDGVEQEGGVPRSAPLYGERDRLLELARGLDHTARHGLTRPDPQPEQCGEGATQVDDPALGVNKTPGKLTGEQCGGSGGQS